MNNTEKSVYMGNIYYDEKYRDNASITQEDYFFKIREYIFLSLLQIFSNV